MMELAMLQHPYLNTYYGGKTPRPEQHALDIAQNTLRKAFKPTPMPPVT